MTFYTIRGEYPRYQMFAAADELAKDLLQWGSHQPGELIDTVSDLTTVMRWFVYHLQPGDVVTWEKTAWHREETDPCERGTVGCSVHHRSDGQDEDASCETW